MGLLAYQGETKVAELVCAQCSTKFEYVRPLAPRRGGNYPKFCSNECRREHLNAAARTRYQSLPQDQRRELNSKAAKKVPCAKCGNPMWRSTTSLPPRKATCNPCRRQASKPKYTPKPAREWDCVVCGTHVVGTARSTTGSRCAQHKNQPLQPTPTRRPHPWTSSCGTAFLAVVRRGPRLGGDLSGLEGGPETANHITQTRPPRCRG